MSSEVLNLNLMSRAGLAKPFRTNTPNMTNVTDTSNPRHAEIAAEQLDLLIPTATCVGEKEEERRHGALPSRNTFTEWRCSDVELPQLRLYSILPWKKEGQAWKT